MINIATHFSNTIRAEPSAKVNAYTHRQINPNIISQKSVTQTFVKAKNPNGLTGKLR